MSAEAAKSYATIVAFGVIAGIAASYAPWGEPMVKSALIGALAAFVGLGAYAALREGFAEPLRSVAAIVPALVVLGGLALVSTSKPASPESKSLGDVVEIGKFSSEAQIPLLAMYDHLRLVMPTEAEAQSAIKGIADAVLGESQPDAATRYLMLGSSMEVARYMHEGLERVMAGESPDGRATAPESAEVAEPKARPEAKTPAWAEPIKKVGTDALVLEAQVVSRLWGMLARLREAMPERAPAAPAAASSPWPWSSGGTPRALETPADYVDAVPGQGAIWSPSYYGYAEAE